MASDFLNLRAYQVPAELSNDLYRLIKGWSDFDKDTTGRELLRTIDSVSANVAEAMGRYTRADRRVYLRIARGSMTEAENWILKAHQRGLLEDDMSDRVRETLRLINGLIKRPV